MPRHLTGVRHARSRRRRCALHAPTGAAAMVGALATLALTAAPTAA